MTFWSVSRSILLWLNCKWWLKLKVNHNIYLSQDNRKKNLWPTFSIYSNQYLYRKRSLWHKVVGIYIFERIRQGPATELSDFYFHNGGRGFDFFLLILNGEFIFACIYYFFKGFAALPDLNQTWLTNWITFICFNYLRSQDRAKWPFFNAPTVNKLFF